MSDILLLIIIIVLTTVLRLGMRALFFKHKLQLNWKLAFIPFYSNALMHRAFNEEKRAVIGMVLRWVGGIMLCAVIAWQWYEVQVQLTHFYGLYFGHWQPTDYSTIWDVMTFAGFALWIIGAGIRLFTTKRISVLFGVSRAWNLVGMLLPSIYELYLAYAKKRMLMHKSPKDMTREEYQMYCAMRDDV